MEFATEMIIKSSRYGARITRSRSRFTATAARATRRTSKRRDGWRTLRFF